jgi:hypothetical protein
MGRTDCPLPFDTIRAIYGMIRLTLLILMLVFVAVGMFANLLPSNDKRDTDTDTQTDGRNL